MGLYFSLLPNQRIGRSSLCTPRHSRSTPPADSATLTRVLGKMNKGALRDRRDHTERTVRGFMPSGHATLAEPRGASASRNAHTHDGAFGRVHRVYLVHTANLRPSTRRRCTSVLQSWYEPVHAHQSFADRLLPARSPYVDASVTAPCAVAIENDGRTVASTATLCSSEN
ncbi:hypothetical protein PYCCODRAFT_1200763 [Trametes coccinea BRFM310]|uniref:Uncharacterized protein n=1 Tax=Trametes coccinea (strain BRFM310) TaxID=1353009 RepID=A0A1Y2I928_TRAC3|nr:hypothetical protein PYCCODRAFT_1200763 [Trametes coccinea BRFM310]